METQIFSLEAITKLKEKLQDQRELPNVTYKQQIQKHHQLASISEKYQTTVKSPSSLLRMLFPSTKSMKSVTRQITDQ